MVFDESYTYFIGYDELCSYWKSRTYRWLDKGEKLNVFQLPTVLRWKKQLINIGRVLNVQHRLNVVLASFVLGVSVI